jgi:ACS family sodium-dependent inorganic phosphate cotransporter
LIICRVNYLDIAPHHASFIMGIGSTVGSLAGICNPLLTGYIVTTPVSYTLKYTPTSYLFVTFLQTVEQWRIVFCIASGIFLFGAFVYSIFASGEVQPWAVVVESKYDLPTEELVQTGHQNISHQRNVFSIL